MATPGVGILAGIAFQPIFAADEEGMVAAIMAGLVTYLLIIFVIFVISVIGLWKVFEKAGQPGWAAIIPFYNVWVLNNEIAKKEPMWFFIYLIGSFLCGPVGIVALIVINIAVSEKFGKGAGYGIGLSLLPFIFYPMLGFGSAQYQGGRKRRAGNDFDDDDYDDRPRRKKDW